jgi:hypothetical protein
VFSQGEWSTACHYVSLPSDAKKVDMKAHCPGLCIVKAITNYTRAYFRLSLLWFFSFFFLIRMLLFSAGILQKTGDASCTFVEGAEPCPLEFLVHYMGDIHQPLHVHSFSQNLFSETNELLFF